MIELCLTNPCPPQPILVGWDIWSLLSYKVQQALTLTINPPQWATAWTFVIFQFFSIIISICVMIDLGFNINMQKTERKNSH